MLELLQNRPHCCAKEDSLFDQQQNSVFDRTALYDAPPYVQGFWGARACDADLLGNSSASKRQRTYFPRESSVASTTCETSDFEGGLYPDFCANTESFFPLKPIATKECSDYDNLVSVPSNPIFNSLQSPSQKKSESSTVGGGKDKVPPPLNYLENDSAVIAVKRPQQEQGEQPGSDLWEASQTVLDYVHKKLSEMQEPFTFRSAIYQSDLKRFLPRPVPSLQRRYILKVGTFPKIPLNAEERERLQQLQSWTSPPSILPSDPKKLCTGTFFGKLLASIVNKVILLFTLKHGTWYIRRPAQREIREELLHQFWPQCPKTRRLFRDHFSTFVRTRIRHFRDAIARSFRDKASAYENAPYLRRKLHTVGGESFCDNSGALLSVRSVSLLPTLPSSADYVDNLGSDVAEAHSSPLHSPSEFGTTKATNDRLSGINKRSSIDDCLSNNELTKENPSSALISTEVIADRDKDTKPASPVLWGFLTPYPQPCAAVLGSRSSSIKCFGIPIRVTSTHSHP